MQGVVVFLIYGLGLVSDSVSIFRIFGLNPNFNGTVL